MARKAPETRRKERQARRAAVQPRSKFGKGSVVEVTGEAKVDHHDPDFGHIKSNHSGAVGRVEDMHFSEDRGEMMAAVKLEDEQTRFIPESRLNDVQPDAMPTLKSDQKRAARDRQEAQQQQRLAQRAAREANPSVNNTSNSAIPADNYERIFGHR